MEQPSDGIMRSHFPGMLMGQLLEVIGAIYGLLIRRVREETDVARLSLDIHSLDTTVFM